MRSRLEGELGGLAGMCRGRADAPRADMREREREGEIGRESGRERAIGGYAGFGGWPPLARVSSAGIDAALAWVLAWTGRGHHKGVVTACARRHWTCSMHGH